MLRSLVGSEMCIRDSATSASVLINVYKLPKFTAQPESVVHMIQNQENNVTFVCDVSGHPKPDIYWYYRSYRDQLTKLLPSVGPELEIQSITKNSSGYYFCKAKNIYGEIESDVARLDVVLTELPRHYIEMSINLLTDNSTINGNTNLTSSNISINSRSPFFAKLAEQLRTNDQQKVTWNVWETSSKKVLFFIIESLYSMNVTSATSPRQLIEISSKSRRDLANSASALVNLIYSKNHSNILQGDGVVIIAENANLTYKATLNKCKPGFEIHENGIVCGKSVKLAFIIKKFLLLRIQYYCNEHLLFDKIIFNLIYFSAEALGTTIHHVCLFIYSTDDDERLFE